MYPFKPLGVYALDRALDHPAGSARLGRMLEALNIPRDQLKIITDENLPEVVAELQSLWPPAEAPEGIPIHWTRPFIFTLQRLQEEPIDLDGLLARCPEGTPRHWVDDIYGGFRTKWRRKRQFDEESNLVCWTAWEFGTQSGCPHGCQYCNRGKNGKYIAMGLNVEDYVDQVVEPVMRENPWQKCFRMIAWDADHIAFEPEYGVFDLVSRKCAELGDRYIYFHTKSANVEWLADIEPKYRKHIAGVWSTTGAETASTQEPGAATAEERIEAARRCQEMGVSVRFKFKPIVPTRNWREDYAATIKQMLEKVRPESIGMTVVMWMDASSLRDRLEMGELDPAFVDALNASEEEMRGVRSGPFPPSVRKEIYSFLIQEIRRWDKDALLYISTETPQMWEELGEELGQDPRAFVCGCGPVALPGGKLGLSGDFKHSTCVHHGFPDE